ncbi:hypothetical protein [Sphingomonas bacterium]|uniref:linalool dehydratase/isomerase domain-containing protein n=1 Tax=Sphingomonas bacterium TaxID=1895847 RepID=UPI001575A6D7|nr:hypothetical protein [Sphingomonas bacterium]
MAPATIAADAWRADTPPRFDLGWDDEMSGRQIGHLRHIENLSLQPPGDWSHMGTKMHGQEDFGSYRFQLAFMAYALALAHVHRAPNAPGAFRATFDRLIGKLLHPDVWLYWRNVSQGGHALNAHLRPQLGEEWNPVVRDNIMYSAYVQSLTLLYSVLFGDDRYDRPESIAFEHASFFWGDGPKRFAYDQHSLNDLLYWKMVESGYLGIACEPNCVFQICNQPAILGFRMHDVLTGEARADEVIEGYQRTWAEFGRVGGNGHFNMLVTEDSRTVIPNGSPSAWVDGWTGMLMNMWNRDFIRGHYRRQIADLLVPSDGDALAVKLSAPPSHGGLTLDYDAGDFGFVAAWASEMGDAATLDALTRHADRFMAPTWAKGGLYYPRNDRRHDEAGHQTLMEPITGNALLGYAALNVPDGLWALYNQPWGKVHFAEPLIVELADTVDVPRARYDAAGRRLGFTLTRRADRAGPVSLVTTNVFGRGRWTLRDDDGVLAHGDEAGVTGGTVPVRRVGDKLEIAPEIDGTQGFEIAWDAP